MHVYALTHTYMYMTHTDRCIYTHIYIQRCDTWTVAFMVEAAWTGLSSFVA